MFVGVDHHMILSEAVKKALLSGINWLERVEITWKVIEEAVIRK
jgi:hypothetical protein